MLISNKMNIGQKLKALRLAEDLTVEEAAEKIGIDKSLLSRYENNEIKNFGVEALEKCCLGYTISSQYFLLNIPIETQRKLDQHMACLDKLVSLPSPKIVEIERVIDFEYTNYVIVQANVPFGEKYGYKKPKK